jgi:hypothetical protein
MSGISIARLIFPAPRVDTSRVFEVTIISDAL